VKMQENLGVSLCSWARQSSLIYKAGTRRQSVSISVPIYFYLLESRVACNYTRRIVFFFFSHNLIFYMGGLALYPSLLSRYEGKREEKKFRAV